jgi:Family of unknown function (DUF6535)
MWSKYMPVAEEYDKRVSEEWKEDSSGVLTFVSPTVHLPGLAFISMPNLKTGLFSVIVGAFIIESYKKLSSDPANETNFLLRQISQQLTGLGNGTLAQRTEDPSFSPSTRMVCVNTMWSLSLVLSLASALSATLTQQWARRYTQLPQIPSSQKDKARVRSYLFLGTRKYYMHHAVEVTPLLLHLSVFLFFVGLAIFFFSINETVAITISVSVALFALAHFTLTILPCIAHDCPYRTPMSNIWWYLWHAFLSITASYLFLFLQRLHDTMALPSYYPGDITFIRQVQRILVGWIGFFLRVAKDHTKRLKDGFKDGLNHGFQGSNIKGALEAPVNIDVEALGWLFKSLASVDTSKVQEFVASIPGDMVVRLMNNSVDPRKVHFRNQLHTLLHSCASATDGLSEEVRRSRLLICLDAIHHVARAFFIPTDVKSRPDVLSDLRVNFGNTGLMRMLWADNDPVIRVTSLSISALLAKHFLREHPPDLAWLLEDVLGEPRTDLATVDTMNIDSFVYGVLSSNQSDSDNSFLNDQVFVETLLILMIPEGQTTLPKSVLGEELSALIQRAGQEGHRLHDLLPKLHDVFEHFFPPDEPDQTNAGNNV